MGQTDIQSRREGGRGWRQTDAQIERQSEREMNFKKTLAVRNKFCSCCFYFNA